jgi:uncharacterized protein YbjT (DUF2867 family)
VILVAGGTGTLGRPLVRMLAARGETVRVLTRNEHHANALRDTGVEVVIGDVRVAADLASAVQGCTTVIAAIHGFTGPRSADPASIDRDGNRNLIGAALDADVDHMILVSAYGAAPNHPMTLHQMKYAAEQSLIASGLNWTIVRPVPFMETWIGVIGARLADQGRALVPGPGDNPVTMVSARDVAALIDRMVRDNTNRGRRLDVVGPESPTLRHIAEQLVAANAGPGRIVHIPVAVLRVLSVLARPLAPAFARQARAAVVMNTTDMTATNHNVSRQPEDVQAATTLAQLLQVPCDQASSGT